ncbi:MAG: RNase adapter RapZ [Rhodospirillales bacterium]|nr:RNase adapter RapZ [Rhodospirillales bacterium]MCB9997118.1 RNase adapter RapZ [Rhodospirillales bacterium]
MTNQTQSAPLLIVTGLSGAGMSSSLKHLEDMGYEVFDNFPLTLVGPLVNDAQAQTRPIAIGIDTRTRGFDPDAVLAAIKAYSARLVFITADEAVLQKRFTETRRRHPLAADRPASAGIKKEQEWLYSLKEKTDDLIDTSMLSIHELRQVLEGRFGTDAEKRLTVTLMSFGFKYGTPREADIVLDVRFLQNPHWVPELKPLTGRDKAVGQYIEKDDGFAPFVTHLKDLIAPLLPRYAAEGKSYLTIAFGCTGGHHRSVYLAETLKPWTEDQGFKTHILHRDIDR